MVQQHNEAVAPLDFFSNPELQPLREAYAAAFFSWVLGQRQSVFVKLDKDRFPDFNLKLADSVVGFELVEADRPGRRRTDEYKKAAHREAAGLPEEVERFDPDADEREAFPAIQDAVNRKAAKHYKPAPPLLVYVNFMIFDNPSLSPGEFAALLEPWRDSFPELWLLWGANAIRCWPDSIRLVGVAPRMRP